MRISDWSSDVCSSDLNLDRVLALYCLIGWSRNRSSERRAANLRPTSNRLHLSRRNLLDCSWICPHESSQRVRSYRRKWKRSEEHTSELQSLMRISYAVFCLKKKILIIYFIFLSFFIYS